MLICVNLFSVPAKHAFPVSSLSRCSISVATHSTPWQPSHVPCDTTAVTQHHDCGGDDDHVCMWFAHDAAKLFFITKEDAALPQYLQRILVPERANF